MDIYEIRRRNLWSIVHPNGYNDQNVKAFSERTGKSIERVRHLVAVSPDKKPAKTIGSTAARDFEGLLSIVGGWLDQPHPEVWWPEAHEISETARHSDEASFIKQARSVMRDEDQIHNTKYNINKAQLLEKLTTIIEKSDESAHELDIFADFLSYKLKK